MATQDKCCTIVPYFKVHSGKLDTFKAMCEQFVEKTETEPKCLYYGFSFDGDQAHCREGYEDAEGLLAHLDNVGTLLQEALQIAETEPDRQIVFFAAGFETTTAPVASLLVQGIPDNLTILLSGRLTWPAVSMLLMQTPPVSMPWWRRVMSLL